MLGTVKRWLSEPETTVVYECRTCGANVDADTDTCPLCESRDIVRFDC